MSSPQKIHYEPPTLQLKRMRCSYGGEGTLRTTDPNQVTCCNCLLRINNKTVGRPKKLKGETTKKTAFSLSPEAWKKVQSIPKSERSRWINDLILKL